MLDESSTLILSTILFPYKTCPFYCGVPTNHSVTQLDKMTGEQIPGDTDSEYQYEEVPVDEDFVTQGE